MNLCPDPFVEAFLASYPRSCWDRVLVSLLHLSISSLMSQHKVPLSLEQLQELARNSHLLANPPGLQGQLNDISGGISRLEKEVHKLSLSRHHHHHAARPDDDSNSKAQGIATASQSRARSTSANYSTARPKDRFAPAATFKGRKSSVLKYPADFDQTPSGDAPIPAVEVPHEELARSSHKSASRHPLRKTATNPKRPEPPLLSARSCCGHTNLLESGGYSVRGSVENAAAPLGKRAEVVVTEAKGVLDIASEFLNSSVINSCLGNTAGDPKQADSANDRYQKWVAENAAPPSQSAVHDENARSMRRASAVRSSQPSVFPVAAVDVIKVRDFGASKRSISGTRTSLAATERNFGSNV